MVNHRNTSPTKEHMTERTNPKDVGLKAAHVHLTSYDQIGLHPGTQDAITNLVIVTAPDPRTCIAAWALIANADYPGEWGISISRGNHSHEPPALPIPTLQRAWIIGNDWTWPQLTQLAEHVAVTLVTTSPEVKHSFYTDHNRDPKHLLIYAKGRSMAAACWYEAQRHVDDVFTMPDLIHYLNEFEKAQASNTLTTEMVQIWVYLEALGSEPENWHEAGKRSIADLALLGAGAQAFGVNRLEAAHNRSNFATIPDLGLGRLVNDLAEDAPLTSSSLSRMAEEPAVWGGVFHVYVSGEHFYLLHSTQPWGHAAVAVSAHPAVTSVVEEDRYLVIRATSSIHTIVAE